MFRFTIRDVLWLMVVVGLAVALMMSQRQLSMVKGQLHDEQAQKRIADLRERELRGGVILTPSIQILNRGEIDRSRAKDE